mmetsp:Transcript_26450/g.67586  ORF Transcript_26450/g.67586 Transcript_26450/m.67586 type:complete len:209 (-) Transcript_26450:2054-2680(-)
MQSFLDGEAFWVNSRSEHPPKCSHGFDDSQAGGFLVPRSRGLETNACSLSFHIGSAHIVMGGGVTHASGLLEVCQCRHVVYLSSPSSHVQKKSGAVAARHVSGVGRFLVKNKRAGIITGHTTAHLIAPGQTSRCVFHSCLMSTLQYRNCFQPLVPGFFCSENVRGPLHLFFSFRLILISRQQRSLSVFVFAGRRRLGRWRMSPGLWHG